MPFADEGLGGFGARQPLGARVRLPPVGAFTPATDQLGERNHDEPAGDPHDDRKRPTACSEVTSHAAIVPSPTTPVGIRVVSNGQQSRDYRWKADRMLTVDVSPACER
jgi:hypothetical protein